MAEKILNLYDDKWFNQNIIFPKTPFQEIPQKPQQTLSPNSSEDQCPSLKRNVLPDSVLPDTSKTSQTNISGKEFEESEEKTLVQKQGKENRGKRVRRRREKRERGKIKRLSELEFEEIKGFMDLGFVFSEEDKEYSILASVIPGLQRLGKKQGTTFVHNNHDERKISRPYLSESWENPMTNWVIPSEIVNNEDEMKNHLRLWARTVASFAR